MDIVQIALIVFAVLCGLVAVVTALVFIKIADICKRR